MVLAHVMGVGVVLYTHCLRIAVANLFDMTIEDRNRIPQAQTAGHACSWIVGCPYLPSPPLAAIPRGHH